MADTCIECDVAIVGSRFAGSLIAKELSRQRIKVVILEAGSGVQPNINGYMGSFYKASAKVPESPYPPALVSAPSAVVAGRPTALMLSASNWNSPGEHPSLQEHLRASCRWHIALDGPHTEARAKRFPAQRCRRSPFIATKSDRIFRIAAVRSPCNCKTERDRHNT